MVRRTKAAFLGFSSLSPCPISFVKVIKPRQPTDAGAISSLLYPKLLEIIHYIAYSDELFQIL